MADAVLLPGQALPPVPKLHATMTSVPTACDVLVTGSLNETVQARGREL